MRPGPSREAITIRDDVRDRDRNRLAEIVEELFRTRRKGWVPANVVRRTLAEAGVEDVEAAIETLTEAGTLVRAGRGFRRRGRKGVARGRIEILPDGYAYVRFQDGGVYRAGDLRISVRQLPAYVAHGDQVEVALPTDEEPRPRILRVVGREPRRFEGVLERRGRHLFLVPDDPLARRSIWVRPETAKGLEEGVRVLAELEPLDPEDPRLVARVVEVLEGESAIERALHEIVAEKEIRTRFPRAVITEAEALVAARFDRRERGLVDLRDRPFVTIDGLHAKDFDDAVWVQRSRDGYVAIVAIADVARYVAEGSALDKEARLRGTSVYFPGLVYPMLPERLSNDLCSLVPRADRPVTAVELHFDRKGRRRRARLLRGWIHSHARLTYTQVNHFLEDGDRDALGEVSASVPKMLHVLHELVRELLGRRHERGALDFDLPEPEFVLGLHGEVSEILHFERRIAHRAIEELMIAANEAVAEILGRAGLPILYRCHAPPPKDKYEAFRRFVHNLGFQMPPRPDPESFQRIATAVEGTPFEKSVHVLILRTMSQAEYAVEKIGHFGLALEEYAHFTSPIRRYADLVNHRWAHHFLARGGLSAKAAAAARSRLVEVAKHVTERERAAEQAERSYIKVLKARFMEDKVGERFEGVVSGVTNFGIFVSLEEYLVEGMVSIRDLGNDYFIFDEERLELRGKRTRKRFRLGDLVEVELVGVDVAKGHIDFRLLAHHPLSYGRMTDWFGRRASR